MKIINAVYCKKHYKILYSLNPHHFNACGNDCGCFIDGEGLRVGFDNPDDIMHLQLNGDFMLSNLFQKAYNNDCKLTMNNMGTFQLYESSNEGFYSQLVINWDEFKEEFHKIAKDNYSNILLSYLDAKERGLI